MRNKLVTGALAVSTLFAACGGGSEESTKSSVDFDVIVVGAGASGMYAAYTLDNAGLNVKVLEASSTHGGRAQYNESFSDGYIEIGPEEVYSSPDFPTPLREKYLKQATAWAAEEEYDVSTREIRGDSIFFDGEYYDVLPDSGQFRVDIYRDVHNLDSTLLHKMMIDKVDPQHIIYMKDGKTVNAKDDPSYHLAMTVLDDVIFGYEGKDTTYSAILDMAGYDKETLTWQILESYYAISLYATTLDRMWSQQGSDGWRDGGDQSYYVDIPYKKLLDTLYFNQLHKKNMIQYDFPVTEINYTGDIVTVSNAEGESFTANHVVVSVSVEVLKSNLIHFTPDLPKKKVDAYSSMAMDEGWRMYLKFKEPFWNKDSVHDVDIINPGYACRCWVPSKYRAEGVNDPNVMICYIMGKRAEYLSSNFNYMDEVVLGELDLVYGGKTATDLFEKSYHMNYKKNPYIGGVYTYTTKGIYPADGPSMREILGQSVENKVFFAGEGTNHEHYSTVFGAMETGLWASEEILEVRKK
ncbi:MAG: FAD-dependent oxidoreductase [Flavobacteriales bacterium]|nr:FAD-dependent oxidoreductase [Flavobacteriales bacterium]